MLAYRVSQFLRMVRPRYNNKVISSLVTDEVVRRPFFSNGLSQDICRFFDGFVTSCEPKMIIE